MGLVDFSSRRETGKISNRSHRAKYIIWISNLEEKRLLKDWARTEPAGRRSDETRYLSALKQPNIITASNAAYFPSRLHVSYTFSIFNLQSFIWYMIEHNTKRLQSEFIWVFPDRSPLIRALNNIQKSALAQGRVVSSRRGCETVCLPLVSSFLKSDFRYLFLSLETKKEIPWESHRTGWRTGLIAQPKYVNTSYFKAEHGSSPYTENPESENWTTSARCDSAMWSESLRKVGNGKLFVEHFSFRSMNTSYSSSSQSMSGFRISSTTLMGCSSSFRVRQVGFFLHFFCGPLFLSH